MKEFKYITLLLSITLFASCSTDVLDKEPVSSFSSLGFYNTVSDAQSGVYGIYDATQSAFSRNFAFWGEGRADAVSTNHSGDPNLLSQNTLNMTMTSARWSGLYSVISRANYAIKYIPEVFESESELSLQLVGQARALRALCYFYAVRIWGDVPLVVEPFEGVNQEIFVNKTDQDIVLEQVEEDLIFASENCNSEYGGERDRVLITQGGADALLTHLNCRIIFVVPHIEMGK